MTVTLAFNERTKSYFLFREASETNFALVLKQVEEDSKNVFSASVNRLPENIEYTLKPIAKFETALGFLKYDRSNLKSSNKYLFFRSLFDCCRYFRISFQNKRRKNI